MPDLPFVVTMDRLHDVHGKAETIEARLRVMRSVHHQSATPEHYTPPEYIEAARFVLGSIDLDPATSVGQNMRILATEYYTHHGETRPWLGNVYCNAPGERTGALIRAFWRRACKHAFDGGCVLWAGFAAPQLLSLQFLADIDDQRCPGPLEWPTVLIGPGAPLTTGGGRICWISADTGEPQRQPGHGNFFTLLGGSDRQRERFRERFDGWGHMCWPTPASPAQTTTIATTQLSLIPA